MKTEIILLLKQSDKGQGLLKPDKAQIKWVCDSVFAYDAKIPLFPVGSRVRIYETF